MSYTYALIVIDDEGNTVVDHVLTPDQAVKILAPALNHTVPAEAHHEEPETPPREHVSKPRGRKEKASERGKRRVNPDVEKRTAKIIELAAKGLKAIEIAAKLGCPKQTVYNTLSRKAGGVRAAAKGAAPGRGTAKPCCGSTGTRHFKTCPNYRKETIPSFAHEQSKAERPASKPLDGYEYDAVRDAMHDHDFSSAEYALSKKLSPREVNLAIKSTDYDDYLDSR